MARHPLQVVWDDSEGRVSFEKPASSFVGDVTVRARRPEGLPARGSVGGDGDRLVPAFTKHTANPLITTDDAELATIYWPWVQRVDDKIGSPIDTYYMWTSTDHGGATDGIELWTAPDPLGPWTSQGKVYDDTTSGSETETPAVLWDESASLFRMYYQQSGVGNGVQSTLMATSTDGETWTRVGVAVQVPSTTEFIGDGHTGYMIPFRIGTLWGAYHLMGGGTATIARGMSWSTDGITWTVDPRPISYNPSLTGDIDRAVEWNHGYPIRWGDRWWWVGFTADFVSGATPKTAAMVAFPLAPSMRHPVGPAVTLFTLDAGWESTNVRAVHVFAEAGRLYLYYVVEGAIGVAVSEVA